MEALATNVQMDSSRLKVLLCVRNVQEVSTVRMVPVYSARQGRTVVRWMMTKIVPSVRKTRGQPQDLIVLPHV